VLYSQVLFEQDRWDHLVDQFKQEFYKLYGMTLEPLLNIYLQAGLTALKTPYVLQDQCLIVVFFSFTIESEYCDYHYLYFVVDHLKVVC
jgi:hypothetical protein